MKVSEAIEILQSLVDEGHNRELMMQIMIAPGQWRWVTIVSFDATHGPKGKGVVVDTSYSIPLP